MALSGSTSVKVTNYNTLKFSWEVKSQDIIQKTSTVAWKLELTSGEYGGISSSSTKHCNIKVNGQQYGFTGVSIAIGNNVTQVLASGTTVIPHNSDGTKTFSYSFSQYFGIAFNGTAIDTVSGSGTGVLDTIQGVSTITCGDVIIGETSTITINRKNSSFTDTLTYEVRGTKGTIATNTALTSVSWRVPVSIYTVLTDVTYEQCKITCSTYSGSTLIGSTSITVYVQVRLNTNYPTLSPTVVDVREEAIALTGDANNILIKHISNAQYDFNSSAKNAATIAKRKVTCGSLIGETETGTLESVQSGHFSFHVTDSRGLTHFSNVDKTLIEYVIPTCNLSVSAPTPVANNKAKTTLHINGVVFKGSFGAANNNPVIEYRYKESDGDYIDWITAAVTYNGNEYTTSIDIENLNYQLAYTFQARARDSLKATTSTERTVRTTPVFDWSESDFNFNVPLTIEGNPLFDYVVETGTEAMGSNGIWYWSKWKSGKVECYGCRNYGNMGVTTSWGSLWRSDIFAQELPSDLFVNTPEVIEITFRNSSFGAWIAKHENSAPSKTSTGSFIVLRPANATLSQAYISFNIIGRWK